jgi:hypothetical protein
MKRMLMLMIVVALFFSLSSVSAFASSSSSINVNASDLLNAKDVAKYKGKYKTVKDLLKATGWTETPATNVPSGTGRIEVKSIEELAAILNGGLISKTTSSVPTNSVSIASLTGSGTVSSTKTLYSDLFSSIKMYSTGYYSNGSMYNATCSSGLNGFTVGISWTQTNSNAFKVTDTEWKTSVTGTYSYYIGIQGFGNYYSKTLSANDTLDI